MAKGINRVTIIGNLGQDPETKALPSGSYVTNISVATSESWKDKQTGQQQERTEWHRIVFFNRLAEIAGEYLKKGSQVYIEGKLQTRKWQDQNDQDRYTTEIVANEMQMLGSKPDQENNRNKNNSLDSSISSQYGLNQEDSPEGPSISSPQAAQGMDSFDDDIPF